MSSIVPYDVKEQIRQSVDIVDLISSYMPLHRKGRLFLALCPWHNDTKPSLQINPERQSFKCWVCDVGGDIFNFVMQHEGIEFREALVMLADRANIPLQALNQPQAANQAQPKVADKNTLFQAMDWVIEQFHQCLLQSEIAAVAREYFEARQITQESVTKFQLGFSPNSWDWLTNRATKTQFSPQVLEAIGVLGRSQKSGRYYDRFRGRVLFPIHDNQSRAIALGGRILPEFNDGEAAKYINSPETPLFSKSKEFYGLNHARREIAQRKNILVTEGYTDCIMAHQYGFEQTVAVLGTALGESHVRRLRFASDSTITLVLDGDEAGRNRANQILDLFVAEQVDLRILTLPEEMDPCDYLQTHGAEAFQQLIDNAIDALEHKFQITTKNIAPNDTHAADRAIEEILLTLAKAPVSASNRTGLMLPRLARLFHLPEEQLRSRLQQIRSRSREQIARQQNIKSQGANSQGDSNAVTAEEISNEQPPSPLDRELLEYLLLQPESLSEFTDSIESVNIQSTMVRKVFLRWQSLDASGVVVNFARLLLEFDQPEIKNLLVEIIQSADNKAEHDFSLWKSDLLTRYQQQIDQPKSRNNAAALQERNVHEQEELGLLKQLFQQERTRQGISKPTDG